jgi:hypothetical protein
MLIKAFWNEEELPQQWNKSITVSVYKMGHKINCSNSKGISMLPNIYKILSNVLPSGWFHT